MNKYIKYYSRHPEELIEDIIKIKFNFIKMLQIEYLKKYWKM